MKSICLLLIILNYSVIVCAQNFNINGKVQEVSYSQGGMIQHPNVRKPYPLTNCTIYAVAQNKSSKTALRINTQSDSAGNFVFNLPKGQYKFHVLFNGDKQKIEPGEAAINKSETTSNKPKTGWYHSDYWEINKDEPVIINKNWAKQLIITHYQISRCNKCP